MSLETHAIARLFELSRDAVIGVGPDGIVRFVNPAAEAALSLRTGEDIRSLLPGHLLEETAERFITAGSLAGRDWLISAVRSEELLLLTLTPREEHAPAFDRGERVLSDMNVQLFSAQLALDRIIRLTDADKIDALLPYTSSLYQAFYRMKRAASHLSLASLLRQGNVPFRPRPLELGRLCRELCDSAGQLLTDTGIELRCQCPDDPCPIRGDKSLLETMLLNLLSNSLLHCPPGSRILLSLTVKGGRYVVAVDDSGTGISPGRLTGIIQGAEPELTDAEAGAGLGLVLVRGIAELHGGSVLLESRENEGTRIRISLPRPESDGTIHLYQQEPLYHDDGLNSLLTELSVVLDKSVYNRKYFD